MKESPVSIFDSLFYCILSFVTVREIGHSIELP